MATAATTAGNGRKENTVEQTYVRHIGYEVYFTEIDPSGHIKYFFVNSYSDLSIAQHRIKMLKEEESKDGVVVEVSRKIMKCI